MSLPRPPVRASFPRYRVSFPVRRACSPVRRACLPDCRASVPVPAFLRRYSVIRGAHGGNTLRFGLVVHSFSFLVDKVEFRIHFHIGVSIRAHGNNGNLPQRRFFDVVERAFDFLTIHLAAAFDQLALFHIRTDAQLPVRSCLALCDDIGRIPAVGDNLSGDLQCIVPNCAEIIPIRLSVLFS